MEGEQLSVFTGARKQVTVPFGPAYGLTAIRQQRKRDAKGHFPVCLRCLGYESALTSLLVLTVLTFAQLVAFSLFLVMPRLPQE